MLDLIASLPQDVKFKILLYYFSYGTPSAQIMRSEIIKKCKNNSVTIWFANVDYIIHTNKKYMLNKSIGCPFEVLCELRIALIDNNIENGTADDFLKSRKMPITNNLYTLTKNTLLQVLNDEKEKEIFIKK